MTARPRPAIATEADNTVRLMLGSTVLLAAGTAISHGAVISWAALGLALVSLVWAIMLKVCDDFGFSEQAYFQVVHGGRALVLFAAFAVVLGTAYRGSASGYDSYEERTRQAIDAISGY